MIVTRLEGGLGNQLFQYAAGRALAHRLGATLKLDLSFYKCDPCRRFELGHFQIKADSLTPFYDQLFNLLPSRFRLPRKLSKIGRLFGEIPSARLRYLPKGGEERGEPDAPGVMKILHDQEKGFDPRFLSVGGDVYLWGYWQSGRYFAPAAPLIREEFKFRSAPDAENQAMLDRVRSSEAVALHVRRGDFLTYAHTYACGPDYYRDAIETLRARVRDPHYFIFSDDPEWTRTHVKPGATCTYVTHNLGRRDFEDLRLMSACRHFVIANSTFSWWAAWLGEHPDKRVICPTPWFGDPQLERPDMIPESWVQLPARAESGTR